MDNKQAGNIACSKDSVKIMADMKENSQFLGPWGENIVKTTNDYWVFSKTSNLREFYIVLQQKNASLIGISGQFFVFRLKLQSNFFLYTQKR